MEEKKDGKLLKFPAVKPESVVPAPVSDNAPLSDEIRAELSKHVKPPEDGPVMSDGTVYQKDAKGTLSKVDEFDKSSSGYWCVRCRRAEDENEKLRAAARALIRERDLLRDRILAMCLAIRERGFVHSENATPADEWIGDFRPFMDIERFARGVPHESAGALLRDLPKDGKRAVVRIKSNDAILECGHIRVWNRGEVVKLNDRLVCDLCTAMLRERDLLDEGLVKAVEKHGKKVVHGLMAKIRGKRDSK